jgi:hypothetical protein
VYVVALTHLAGNLDDEAAPLAAIAGVSVYDIRAWVGRLLPHIVFQSPNEADAAHVLAEIRGRGHGAMACDSRAICGADKMVRVHRFTFDDTTFWANDGRGEHVAFSDVAVLILAASRTDVVRITREKEVIAGSTRPPPSGTVDHATNESVTEQAAYLFLRQAPGAAPPRPWLLHEREARYLALGAAMQPTRHANFAATVALLRARSSAVFDDRFAGRPRGTSQLLHIRGHDAAAPSLSDTNIDLTVHFLAAWLARGQGGPYREAR